MPRNSEVEMHSKSDTATVAGNGKINGDAIRAEFEEFSIPAGKHQISGAFGDFGNDSRRARTR